MLTIEGDDVHGEIAIAIAPGTKGKQIERLLIEALNGPLNEAAESMLVVLAAPPARYARELPGRDAEGRTRYAIRARAEGGRLLPAHKGTPYTRNL